MKTQHNDNLYWALHVHSGFVDLEWIIFMVTGEFENMMKVIYFPILNASQLSMCSFLCYKKHKDNSIALQI